MGPDEYSYMYKMEEHHWWFFTRRNFIVDLIGSFRLAAPKILDVGAGTGANLAALSKIGEAFRVLRGSGHSKIMIDCQN